jgi:hypothetical protein
MKRLVVILGALALALPVGAGALQRAPSDGTLVVENAQGVVTLNVRGGIIGRFDSGSIVIEDPMPGDGPGPVVRGYQDATEIGPSKVQYSSKGEIRFRLIGGLYRVRIAGQGVDVSVVGRGTAVLNGAGFSDLQTGRYSLNGGPWQRMPNLIARFTLGAAPFGPSSK